MLYNAIELTEENLPYIIDVMGDDTKHIAWLKEWSVKLPVYNKLERKHYILKDYEVNGGFVYPYVIVSDEYLSEGPMHSIQIMNHF